MFRVGEIDYNKKPKKESLFLCNSRKQTMSHIHDAYDITIITRIGSVSELSFKIPPFIEKDFELIQNPHIDKIKQRYLIKYKIGEVVEYFLITNADIDYSESEDYIEYKAQSLGIQLADKSVRSFEHYGHLKSVMEELLNDTYGHIASNPIKRWSVGTVDAYYTAVTMERSYSISSTTLLEVIYDIAEKWEAILEWDTVNLEINVKRAENVGFNKGFRISDKKYLQSLNMSVDATATVTRLFAYGNQDVESKAKDIRLVSQTGEPYIEDFSYFMFPFEYDDENDKVITSSYHMSDSLAIALHKHKKKVKDSEGQFQQIQAKVDMISSQLITEQQRLSDIVRERILIENERDILLAEYQDDREAWGTNGFNNSGTKVGTPKHSEILERLALKQQEESIQQTIVDNMQMNVDDAMQEKADFQWTLASNNPENFTSEQLSELENYIIHKDYSNDSITDPQDLLKEAQIVFKQWQQPKIQLSVNIADFTKNVESQHDWDKIGLGDTVKVWYEPLRVNISAKIVEITRNLESDEIQLTIANEKDLSDGSQKLIDMINKGDSASSQISLNKDKWNLSEKNNGMINEYINNELDAIKQAIRAGVNQKIEISERGLIARDETDPNSLLILQAGVLAISNDNGNSWSSAINRKGVFADVLHGRQIVGTELLIEDESGVWKTQGARTTVYKSRIKNEDGTWENPEEVMWLGLVSDNKRDQFDNLIRQEEESFGLKAWTDSFQVEMSTTTGIAMSRWGNKYTNDGEFGWEKVFWADKSGTLYTRDLVAQSLKIVNDIGETILDAENGYINITALEQIVDDSVFTPQEKIQIYSRLHDIHSQYKSLLSIAKREVSKVHSNESLATKPLRNEDGSQVIYYAKHTSVNTARTDYDVIPLIEAYATLIHFMQLHMNVVANGVESNEAISINLNGKLTTSTTNINNRGQFIQMFRDYYDQALYLQNAIDDYRFNTGLQKGENYNNVVINEHGLLAVRDDGKFRAYLNATNGFALQSWENVSKVEGITEMAWKDRLYATLDDPNYPDGTLFASNIVTENLRIVDSELVDRITFDHEQGIIINAGNKITDRGSPFLDVYEKQIRLNADVGIEIRNGEEKRFWVDDEGSLFASNITTHNLKIVDGELGAKILFDQARGIIVNAGEKVTSDDDPLDEVWEKQIKLNANDGIELSMSGKRKLWFGYNGMIFARDLYIFGDDEDETALIDEVEGSYISSLSVNKVKTINRDKNVGSDIIHLEKNFMKFVTQMTDPTTQKKYDKAKLEFTYHGTGNTSYPVMIFGAGNGKDYEDGSEQAKIYKDNTKFAIEYDHKDNKMTRFYFNETDTDDKGQSVYFESEGGIRFHSNNKFVAKTADNKYLSITQNAAKLQFGSESFIEISPTQIRLRFNQNNFITITDAGIIINGKVIELN